MHLILHIGTEKTGTTTLQSWLDANAGALLRQKFWYCESLGRPNNVRMAVLAQGFNPEEAVFSRLSIETEQDHRRWKQEQEEALTEEVETARRSGAQHFVISNEHCHSRLVTPEMVGELHTLIERVFTRCTVLCYLRPQADLVQSRLSTIVRAGKRVRAQELKPARIAQRHDYHDLLGRWKAHFGDDITLLPYKRFADLVGSLAGALGVDPRGFTSVPALNQALDYRVAALVNALEPDGLRPKGQTFARMLHLDSFELHEPMRLSRSLAREITEACAPANSALVATSRGITLDDLTPDFARYPEQGNTDVLDETPVFSAALTELLRRYNAEIALERLRTELALMELSKAKAQHSARRKAAERAQVQLARLRHFALPDQQAAVDEMAARLSA